MDNITFNYARALDIAIGLFIGLSFLFLLRKNNGGVAGSADDYSTRAARYSAFSELILTLVFPLSAVGVIAAICIVIVTGQGESHLAVLVAILPTLLSGTGKLLAALRGKEIDDGSNSSGTAAGPAGGGAAVG